MDSDKPRNFIEQIIEQDLASGAVRQVVTRFPPEPNGYLHIGHAKSICLNFGLAERHGGVCHLRFDDTNPETESEEFVNAIIADVRWLGFQWHGPVRYASDYFDQLHAWAVHLIEAGKAYVCELDPEQMRQYRGTLTEPGRDSPWRDRPVAENLALFAAMRAGEVEEGRMVLRARIDMAAPNINLRDPVLYRVKRMAHHRSGASWNIYPSYDYAHGQEDAIEGVTHSICTLEFADHRPLYDWFIANLPVPSQPRQYEFGRLNLNYTVTSKRKLKQLVADGHVDGWDDPRLPTLAGLRRRGVTPAAIRAFCDSLAVARTDGIVDMAQFEHFIRADLNDNAPRALCVLHPLRVTLTNWPAGKVEHLELANHPQRPELGARRVPFGGALYIDRDDFSTDTALSRKQFKRLVLGDWVRLRGAPVIRADEVVRDAAGAVIEVLASLVPDTLGSDPPPEIKPRGVIHWVDAETAVDCELRLYDRLFAAANPEAGGDFLQALNPGSLQVLAGCKAEASLAAAVPGATLQFEREGYFCRDIRSGPRLVFNRTIALRDTWAKHGAEG
ncbi:MAG: glutamine--tRNA ligase [Porticoccaceae bacterium]